MSTAETNPTPSRANRQIVVAGVAVLVVCAIAYVGSLVVEKVEDLFWYR